MIGRRASKGKTTNKAFIGAYRKGQAAHAAGEGRDSCPYQDKMGGRHDHVITYSRTFRQFWFSGFDDAARGVDIYGPKPARGGKAKGGGHE